MMSHVDDCLEHLFQLMATRIIDKEPDVPFEQVKADISNALVSQGFSRDVVEKLYKKHMKISDTFAFKGLINPTYLEEETGKKFSFYVIDARHGRYAALSQLIKRWEGDLSRYIVYGPQDVILRLHGTDGETNLIYETLTNANYEFNAIEIGKVHYYYRHRVHPHLPGEGILNHDLTKLVNDWKSKEVSDEMKKQLLDTKILLGCVPMENLAKTHRMRAFVGVSFVGMVPARFRRGFLDYLLNIGEVQSCLSGVYECRTGPYAFVLELVTGDPRELDVATDKISFSYSGTGKVETSTFIIAKAYEQLPLLSKKESLVRTGVNETYVSYLEEIEEHFVPNLSKNQTLAYSKLLPRKQHFLISSIDDLTSMDLSELGDEDRHRFDESLQNFAVGCILDDKLKIENAVNLVSASLEKTCRESLVKLINTFFLGDFSRARKDLSLAGKNVWKFTLGECHKSFEHWNKSMYKNLFVFPETILGFIIDFLKVRNPIVHGTPRWIDIDSMIRDVKDTIFKGMNCVSWLQKNVVQRELEMVSVEDALKISAEIIMEHEDGKKDLDKILTETLKTQKVAIETQHLLTLMFTDFPETHKQLIDKMDEIKDAHKSDLAQMTQALMTAVTGNNDAVLREAMNLIVGHREEILNNTKRMKLGISAGLIQFAKKTVREIPSQTLGNLISQIIINLSPKYLPVIVEMLSATF